VHRLNVSDGSHLLANVHLTKSRAMIDSCMNRFLTDRQTL